MALLNLYGFPDGLGGISKWYLEGNAIVSLSGEAHNGDPLKLAADGWLPLIPDALGVNEKYDEDVANAVAFVDHCSYAIVAMTAEEIQAAADLETITNFQTLYVELMFWNNKTDEELDTLINNYFNSSDPVQIGLSCRAVNKKLAKSVRDIVEMFKLMRETGILPK